VSCKKLAMGTLLLLSSAGELARWKIGKKKKKEGRTLGKKKGREKKKKGMRRKRE